MKKVHLACAASALVLGASLSACSAGHTAVKPTASDSLTIAATGTATSLDFTNIGGAAIPAALMSNVYETLVRIEGDEIVPGLAESWDAKDTTYTFHLRHGVRFSNGDEFTAETAAYSINNVKEKWTNGISKQMEVVESAKALDKYTLQVKLKKHSNSWLWSMGTAIGAMMTPNAMDLATQPVGTGPFELAGFAPGEYISLRPHQNYWGKVPKEQVTIQYFPDAISSVNSLKSGGVDVVWAMQTPELLDNLGEGIRTAVGTTNGEVLLSMNNNAAPFDDPRVRRAVAYAVDRKAANQILWDGLAKDTGGAPVPPTDPWFNEKDYYPYSPQRAKELLQEAGAEGAHITITAPTLPYAQRVSELLYSQLTEVGFDVTLESAEFPAVWLGQVMGAKDYQMSLVSHVEPRDIPTLFGNPDYYLGYDSQKTRDLLSAADSAPESKYAAGMEKAVDQIMADAGALTLMNMPNIVLYRDGIEGLNPNQVTDAIELADLKEAP
ncbi:ABC transporter substrate-binding protein [Corynebacterium simulans]|uniref:Bacterial extracellular solute-binding s, 5 Middle family protein n=1 Tax=Corynebacterium simulans TaxID=146827 RepID=A0ABR5V851_9CORY|nr:ABC transporter substrate-binding protein [Corynebacterium simulans]KXU17498.1 bacterial extracellular solute-binding s, 5 Middle family protein [Corynebacterium simulans]